MEEIKEQFTALDEISEEKEVKLDDVYIALTELAIRQKYIDLQRNPNGFIKPKE